MWYEQGKKGVTWEQILVDEKPVQLLATGMKAQFSTNTWLMTWDEMRWRREIKICCR